MNEKKRLIIVALALVLVLAAGWVIYDRYGDAVNPDAGGISGGATPASPGAVQTENAQKSPAPDFVMRDASGAELNLSDFEGTPVVLNFWTSWCAYCKKEMPSLEQAYKDYGDSVQFVILNATANETSRTSGSEYIEESGFAFPVYYDTEGQGVAQYAVRGFPRTVFIDADGYVFYTHVGFISEDDLFESIEQLIAG